ncbi:MAG TPA: serine/threonine-protein kinase, partial [Kofleriaceae bacterium]|nr:serine/threonine-protein kinase [Kofleriaceae bacterium]
MAASPSPTSDEQFAIGSVLDGRYRIDAVLGTGGMGRVYRAEHIEIGKSVAIKLLHADLHRNREASQRFHREAIASGKLDHPNIVGVSDSGVLDDGARYLVMEMLEGESLGDRLARETRIHWVEAIDILREVLYGLRHAHERGVVHRDIKPDNVYLARKDGDQVIKILDFGIAKLYAGSVDDPASTRAGLTVGTPAYLSPEQAVGGEITPASDLYSASIVLYEMLAGRAPFEDKDPLAMLGAHVSRRPPSFTDIAPGIEVPAALEDIIHRGLAKSAAERIRTANDYLAMLDALSPPRRPRMPTAPAPALGELHGTAGTGPVVVETGAYPPSQASPAGAMTAMTAVTAATPVPGTGA